jgi:hypothetical protein
MGRIARVRVFCNAGCSALLSMVVGTVAVADPVTVPKGMSVPITLQQHVTSGYVAAGSPIHFTVESDVAIGGQVVIRKGTAVLGKMDASQGRGRVGKSGSMAISVRTVEAVDGTVVPIDADFSKQGRSRSGATVAWVLFWGIPGLLTRGVNPYVERGVTWDANLLADVSVDPVNAKPVETLPAPASAIRITGHQFAGGRPDKPLEFNIEKDKDLKTLALKVDPASLVAGADLRSLRLVAVDGEPLVEPVVATGATAAEVVFDTWSIVRYCNDGVTQLTFLGVGPDGAGFGATYPLPVKIKKKG